MTVSQASCGGRCESASRDQEEARDNDDQPQDGDHDARTDRKRGLHFRTSSDDGHVPRRRGFGRRIDIGSRGINLRSRPPPRLR